MILSLNSNTNHTCKHVDLINELGRARRCGEDRETNCGWCLGTKSSRLNEEHEGWTREKFQDSCYKQLQSKVLFMLRKRYMIAQHPTFTHEVASEFVNWQQ